MHPYTIQKLAEGRAAEFQREAYRSSLAKAIAESRLDERRNFLRRMWQKRHRPYLGVKETRPAREAFGSHA